MAEKPRLTEAEFAELARKRDEAFARFIDSFCAERGWDRSKTSLHVHSGGSTSCYCACPDGPCQHEWTGPWRDFEDGHGGEVTCARCGMGSMAHDLRVMP